MKHQTYQRPAIRFRVIETQKGMLAASMTSGDGNITGGGTDKDGTKDPSAKPYYGSLFEVFNYTDEEDK